MAGFLGMDTEAVKALANQMSQSAEQIQQLCQQMTNMLNNTDWRGPDHDQFVNNWQSQHVAQLNNVVTGLNDAAQRATQNANEQESTSNS